LIFYESSHRVEATLDDAARVFPASRRMVIGRELTKRHETLVTTTVGAAPGLLAADPEMRLGEFVLLVEGAPERTDTHEVTPEQGRVLGILLRDHSVKAAVALTVEITGGRRDPVYREALRLASAGPVTGRTG
jgi:16S rRNA (cytidine1402-2'-O)-methyltransferase